ncbi:unnamed protein product [Coregonus sp. 'balchen']|nr:unnamed protein product [Coregonus sp. 'balchen']
MSDKGGEKASVVRKEASPAAQANQNKGAPCAPCCHKVAMAVPPAYSDLGKAAKDIFGKGYDQLFCKCSCFTTVKLESLDDPH